jgi:hypothetical protein
MGFDRLKSEPWIRVRELLDEAWFVHLADSERQRRMVLRHKSPHMSSSDPPAVPTMGETVFAPILTHEHPHEDDEAEGAGHQGGERDC